MLFSQSTASQLSPWKLPPFGSHCLPSWHCRNHAQGTSCCSCFLTDSLDLHSPRCCSTLLIDQLGAPVLAQGSWTCFTERGQPPCDRATLIIQLLPCKSWCSSPLWWTVHLETGNFILPRTRKFLSGLGLNVFFLVIMKPYWTHSLPSLEQVCYSWKKPCSETSINYCVPAGG